MFTIHRFLLSARGSNIVSAFLLVVVACLAVGPGLSAGGKTRMAPGPATPGGGAAREGRKSVWAGVYTEKQVERGRRQHEQACASCHLDDMLGDSIAPALVRRS